VGDRVTAWRKSGLSSEELGYLEAGLDDAVATGYDPLIDDEPALARTLAASVTQRMAFGGMFVSLSRFGDSYRGHTSLMTIACC
jgi:hypothetical protein